MPWSWPPLAKLVLDLLRIWYFWAIFIALLVTGFLLQKLSPSDQKLFCEGYQSYFEPGVVKTLEKTLGNATLNLPGGESASSRPTTRPTTAPTTQPASAAAFVAMSIRSYFCDRASEVSDDTWVPTFKEARIVVPGAFLLALVIVSLLPAPAPRAAITNRIDEAKSITAGNEAEGNSPRVRDLAQQYIPNALAARQLRIAIAYAILSGVATVVFPPNFGSTRLIGSDTDNFVHMSAVCIAAVIAVTYGTYGFSRSSIKTTKLASRLGFGAILFAGIITLTISLPYQVIRPPELHPMTRPQVMQLLLFRTVILPALGATVVGVARPVLKRIDLLSL